MRCEPLAASCTALSTTASPLVPRCGLPLRLRYGLRSLYLIPPPATLLDGTAEHTKAQVVVLVDRSEPVAVRRTGDVGDAEPAAAAYLRIQRGNQIRSFLAYEAVATSRSNASTLIARLLLTIPDAHAQYEHTHSGILLIIPESRK